VPHIDIAAVCISMSRREARRPFKCKNRSARSALRCGEQTAHQANFSHIGKPKICIADDSTRRVGQPSQSSDSDEPGPSKRRRDDLPMNILFGARTAALLHFPHRSLRGIVARMSRAPTTTLNINTPSAQ
jgi:hypothetical protein